jgi:hypothetical protein
MIIDDVVQRLTEWFADKAICRVVVPDRRVRLHRDDQ